MLARVVALVAALVFLASALGSIETPYLPATASHGSQVAFAVPGGAAAGHAGSVEHHHLDDRSSSTQPLPSTDLPGLPTASSGPPPQPPSEPSSWASVSPALESTPHERPFRPPRPTPA